MCFEKAHPKVVLASPERPRPIRGLNLIPVAGATGDGAAAVIGGEDCTPSYRNNEGQPSPTGRHAALYAPGPIAFFKLLADWREAGTFEGLEFGP